MTRKLSISIIKKTKRLELRFLRKKDFKQWQEFYLSMGPLKNQWDWSSLPLEKLTKRHFDASLKNMREAEDTDLEYRLGVFVKKSGELIGFVLLRHFIRSKIQYSCEVGYQITNKYWGKGYGTEAVKGVLALSFNELKVRRVEAGVNPNNRRSVKLLKKVGMQRIGVSKGHFSFDGEMVDQTLYSIVR